MKEDHRAKVRGIEESLKAAHRRRGLPKTSDSFAAGVMREIRTIGRFGNARAAVADSVFDAPDVWRFAGAAAMVTVVVCGYFLLNESSGISIEMAEFAASDPSALILAHSLALI